MPRESPLAVLRHFKVGWGPDLLSVRTWTGRPPECSSRPSLDRGIRSGRERGVFRFRGIARNVLYCQGGRPPVLASIALRCREGGALTTDAS